MPYNSQGNTPNVHLTGSASCTAAPTAEGRCCTVLDEVSRLGRSCAHQHHRAAIERGGGGGGELVSFHHQASCTNQRLYALKHPTHTAARAWLLLLLACCIYSRPAWWLSCRSTLCIDWDRRCNHTHRMHAHLSPKFACNRIPPPQPLKRAKKRVRKKKEDGGGKLCAAVITLVDALSRM